METRKCTVCGKEKPLSEMSKSYPTRCKECVAEHTRMVRQIARRNDADLIAKNIDWEQRRYEIAKAAMRGLLSNHEALNPDVVRRYGVSFAEDLAHSAIKYADALIKELKGNNHGI